MSIKEKRIILRPKTDQNYGSMISVKKYIKISPVSLILVFEVNRTILLKKSLNLLDFLGTMDKTVSFSINYLVK